MDKFKKILKAAPSTPGHKNEDLLGFDGTSQPRKSFFEKTPFGGMAKPSFFHQPHQAPKKEENFEMNENDTDLIDLTQDTPNVEPITPIEKQDSQPSKTSFTTANGDGLTFDPFSMNIFDEIQEIIAGKNKMPIVVQKQPKIEEKIAAEDIEDFTMDDLPDNLQPHSVLMEVIEQIENLKQQLQPLQDRDQDLLNCIKQLKRPIFPDKIYTCSYTLDSVVQHLKNSLDSEDLLKEKLSKQSKSIFHLKNQLVDQKSKNQKLESSIEILSNELSQLNDEKTGLTKRCEHLEKLVEDTRAMTREDSLSFQQEFYSTKIKSEKYKSEIQSLKKQMKKLRSIEVKHDILQENIRDMQFEKENQIQKEILKQEQRKKSILGFMELQYPFQVTLQFLEPKSMFKILALNKEIRGNFLQNIEGFTHIQQLYQEQIRNLKSAINDKHSLIQNQERSIKFLKESDELRNQLMQETSEEKIKEIIYKFIVKPDIDKKMKKGCKSIVADINVFLTQNEHFVQDYVEMHTANQIKEQKEMLKKQIEEAKRTGAPIPTTTTKDEGFWAKKWIKGAGNSINKIKDFKVELPIPKLPPMPAQQAKQPEIIPEATVDLQIEHESAPPKVVSLMEPIDEQQIESTPPATKLIESTPPATEPNPYQEEQTTEFQPEPPVVPPEVKPEPVLVVPEIKPLLDNFDNIETVDQMNTLLLSLGSFLVQDKLRLSKWIQGIQHGFAQFYIASKHLSHSAKELEILKEFLAIKIEQLQLRVQELLNEKEDLVAMNKSNAAVKEHLLYQMNEIDRQFTQKNTELLIKSQRVQELEQIETVESKKRESERAEIRAFKKEVAKEVKQLRKESQLLENQNMKYRKSLLSLKLYMDKMMVGGGEQPMENSSKAGSGSFLEDFGSFIGEQALDLSHISLPAE